MGDHRPDFIKIQAKMHGVEHNFDFGWCNYCGWDDGIDSRIKDFFQKWFDEAMAAYEAQVYEFQRDKREKRELAERKRQYKKLKEEFEPVDHENQTSKGDK